LAHAIALIAFGVVSTACGLLTKAYAAEYGGESAWWAAMALGAGYVPLGVLVGLRGERWEWLGVGVVATLFGVGTCAQSIVRHSPAVMLGASLVALPFAVLLWPRSGRLRMAIGLAGVVTCALLLARKTAGTLSFPPLSGPPVTFEIVLVDESACDLVGSDVPATGSTSAQATAGVETIGGRKCSFIRFEARSDATFKQACRDANAWAATRARLPVGTRLAWGRQDDAPGMVLRSYPIRGQAVVTSVDVSSAEAQTEDGEVSLALSFQGAASQRFQTVTREHRGERLALLLDGGVQLAPVITAEIKGGRLLLSLTDTTAEQARSFATAARGELLHAPVGWGQQP
jgi:hypothetical protein